MNFKIDYVKPVCNAFNFVADFLGEDVAEKMIFAVVFTALGFFIRQVYDHCTRKKAVLSNDKKFRFTQKFDATLIEEEEKTTKGKQSDKFKTREASLVTRRFEKKLVLEDVVSRYRDSKRRCKHHDKFKILDESLVTGDFEKKVVVFMKQDLGKDISLQDFCKWCLKDGDDGYIADQYYLYTVIQEKLFKNLEDWKVDSLIMMLNDLRKGYNHRDFCNCVGTMSTSLPLYLNLCHFIMFGKFTSGSRKYGILRSIINRKNVNCFTSDNIHNLRKVLNELEEDTNELIAKAKNTYTLGGDKEFFKRRFIKRLEGKNIREIEAVRSKLNEVEKKLQVQLTDLNERVQWLMLDILKDELNSRCNMRFTGHLSGNNKTLRVCKSMLL